MLNKYSSLKETVFSKGVETGFGVHPRSGNREFFPPEKSGIDVKLTMFI
jgi:hypothetical protein